MEQLVGDSIRGRISGRATVGMVEQKDLLPSRLKADAPVRSGMLRRLATSARFAHGDRAGALRAAQRRSGRPSRLDVRQRVVVKALVSRHASAGGVHGAALMRHASYLGRAGAGAEGGRPDFFDRDRDGLDALDAVRGWTGDRHHFRLIVSPEHGDRIEDFPAYVREVMGRVAKDLGEPELSWIATAHFDTDQPHAHVLVRGRRGNGRDLVIPRAYVGYGIRARAQEVAQERLGDLSRHDAEKRIWRETEANRFTNFDRRLLESRSADGTVADGVGRGAWAALMRGRLRHLELIGLAARVGQRYQLAPDLEQRLRSLQLHSDIIRTLNARRLESDAEVQQMEESLVRGRVVRSGYHDELGAMAFAIVRDRDGAEHYARLASGVLAPQVGSQATLLATERGAVLSSGRGAAPGLDR